jgi:DNA repair protein RadA/Sms
MILLAGEPGIGKSTLALQFSQFLPNLTILYASGEENLQQLATRSKRLFPTIPDNLYFLESAQLEVIENHLQTLQPQLCIIDSVQLLYSEAIDGVPGGITQIRECVSRLIHTGRRQNTAILFIGHVTKEGEIAGPKLLEHLVDVVLTFEGDSFHDTRLLLSGKNRYGPTAQVVLLEMTDHGLRVVKDTDHFFLPSQGKSTPGVAVVSQLQGNRFLLLEVQSLVTATSYPSGQRSVTGLDLRRLHMLIAVIEKWLQLPFAQQDVFVNVAGGMRLVETGTDLGILAALISSFLARPIPAKTLFIGEVSLTGDVYPVNRIQERIKEGQKHHFTTIVLPKSNEPQFGPDLAQHVSLVPIARVEEILQWLQNPALP